MITFKKNGESENQQSEPSPRNLPKWKETYDSIHRKFWVSLSPSPDSYS